MDGGTGCKVVLGVLIALLQALGWFMSVGGAGKLHNECNDYVRDEDCVDIFRPVWWSVFYQLITLLIVTVVVAFGGLGRFRIPVVALLVISTVRTMEEAERGLKLRNLDSGFVDSDTVDALIGLRDLGLVEDSDVDEFIEDHGSGFVKDNAVNAFIGGSVLMSIVNLLLIVLVGNTAEVDLDNLTQRIWAMMGRTAITEAGAGGPAVGRPAQPQPPPTQVEYPKHGGFETQPPTFNYTQQQQQ